MMDYDNLPDMEDFVIVYKDNDQKNFGFIFKEHSKKRCVMIKAVNENAIPTP